MWEKWVLRNPTSSLTKKRLLTQCSNIRNKRLLSQLEIDEARRCASSTVQISYGKGEPGRQVSVGVISSSSPNIEIGYTAPMTDGIGTRAADLRERIMESWGNSTTSLPRLTHKVPDKSLLEDMNTALSTIPTTTITETNQLMYAAATVILQMLGYKMKRMNSHKEQMAPWRRRLEAKIMATRREVSLLTELSRGVNPRTERPKKYNKLSIPEALEAAKQRLTALATRIKRYIREVEERRINRVFSTNPAKVYSQWQGNKMTTDPPKAKTEQYWKSI
ncbi:hypothetical protein D4764_14G0004230 [Takifugu flavidus]|uniref:Uncharacterized protein n=1 Tax=Takifugu flavidus TaxID=433684 RepID=A0A5C6P866_9TELE|nr:hypothetical protein D4764_14G0004230 [Takifugu flavidus]